MSGKGKFALVAMAFVAVPGLYDPAQAKPRAKAPVADAGLLAIKALQGPVTIIISISEQRLALYDGDQFIDSSEISTGIADHPTPTGVFTILQKDLFHKSNIYSEAPMPFMQRLTWSGIALHEGRVPGHPASHGCIRLPREFAKKLWRQTRLGARVIIAGESIGLTRYSHASLFRPADASKPLASPPAQISIPAEVTAPLHFVAADGATRPATIPSPGPLEKTDAPWFSGETFGPPKPTIAQWVAMRKRTGPVSVFVSRKEGRLFVRQDLTPLFDAPVELASKDAPIGTHVFTATDYAPDRKSMSWTVATLPASFAPKLRVEAKPRVPLKPKNAIIDTMAPLNPPPVAHTASQALERMKAPAEALEQIAQLLIPGSTFIISDMGLGGETGKGTDFIVVRY